MEIKITKLSKTIAGTKVLDDVSLNLYSGKIYGLSGINGSGKTMLMRAICGLIKPSEGEISIDGKILGKHISFPRSVGALIENPAFISKYTGYKNLKVLASIQNKISNQDIQDMLTQVGLERDDKRPYRKYSLGMKQRLGIACVFMEQPELILLDEPINALDDEGIKLVNIQLKRARNRGALIILSAHDKNELELLSDEIFTLVKGKITDHKEVKKEYVGE